MNISHLFIGLCSGLVVGLAVASHPLSRAIVTGLVAIIVVGGLAVEGVEGFLAWMTYFLAEMAKFADFSVALVGGLVSGAVVAWMARHPRDR